MIAGVAMATVPTKKTAGQGVAKPVVPAVAQPGVTLSKEETAAKFREVCALSVDDQAMTFLRAFVVEFQGNFEEVLDLAEEFKTFGKGAAKLEKNEAHRFLEARGETRTASDLRATLQFIDRNVGASGDLFFIEYLLFKYNKHPAALFEESTASNNAELIRKLEEAVENYRRVFREKKELEERMAALRLKSDAGDVKAKAELKRLEMQDPAKSAADEALALQKKLSAKRALANPDSDKERLLAEEQRRVAEEKQRQEAEEKRKRDESKKRLAEKAKLFGK